jgi:hypothetical protein
LALNTLLKRRQGLCNLVIHPILLRPTAIIPLVPILITAPILILISPAVLPATTATAVLSASAAPLTASTRRASTK